MDQQIALILCIAVGVFLIIKEYLRPQKARMAWRLIASVLAILSFYFLLFPQKYQSENQVLPQEITFLTAGTTADRIPGEGRLYTNDSTLLTALKGKVTFIPDLFLFLQTNTQVSKINLYGYGLPESELQQLQAYEFNFHPAAIPAGLLQANWNRKIIQTEELLIQGVYHHKGKKPVHLVLKGLGLHLDSVLLRPGITTRFSLKTRPPLSGRAVYQLLAIHGTDTLSNEPVPVELLEENPIRILMLASAPDFEYKFLKNWLYENKYPVIFRTQISKGKYSIDYLNVENTRVSTVNAGLLKNMDLVVVDEETWASLSGAERAAINAAVQAGIGLLQRTKTARPTRLSGRGKIVTSAVPETYSLLLSGKKGAYAAFWSDLLEKGARKRQTDLDWQILPAFPIVGTKARVVVDQARAMDMPQVLMAGEHLALRQNMEKPFQWDAFFWPKKSGWNKVDINGKSNYFYVYEKSQWLSHRRYYDLQHTTARLKPKNSSTETISSTEMEEKTISLWWYFVVLLLSVGYLWYEARFFRNKVI